MPHLSAHALQPGKVLHPAGTFLRTCSFSFHLDVLVIGEVDVTKQASKDGCLPFRRWGLFPVVALLAAAAAIEYLVPGGGERPRVSWSAGSQAAEDEDGRGRLATTPSEIPPRGWKDILLRVYSNVSQHRILAPAAGYSRTRRQ
jgi:hypothetical protein